jgi:hypothetical protein
MLLIHNVVAKIPSNRCRGLSAEVELGKGEYEKP